LENFINDEDNHDRNINKFAENNNTKSGNIIPRYVVKHEVFYDLKDRFRKPTNKKTNSSTLNFDIINLGTGQCPQTINFGKDCTPAKKSTFIKLLKQYKDIFSWSYGYLKTYDTYIIQHTIPILLESNPIQQNLRKIHPNLETRIKDELNKLLKSKIIFPVKHSQWVSNIVLVSVVVSMESR